MDGQIALPESFTYFSEREQEFTTVRIIRNIFELNYGVDAHIQTTVGFPPIFVDDGDAFLPKAIMSKVSL